MAVVKILDNFYFDEDELAFYKDPEKREVAYEVMADSSEQPIQLSGIPADIFRCILTYEDAPVVPHEVLSKAGGDCGKDAVRKHIFKINQTFNHDDTLTKNRAVVLNSPRVGYYLNKWYYENGGTNYHQRSIDAKIAAKTEAAEAEVVESRAAEIAEASAKAEEAFKAAGEAIKNIQASKEMAFSVTAQQTETLAQQIDEAGAHVTADIAGLLSKAEANIAVEGGKNTKRIYKQGKRNTGLTIVAIMLLVVVLFKVCQSQRTAQSPPTEVKALSVLVDQLDLHTKESRDLSDSIGTVPMSAIDSVSVTSNKPKVVGARRFLVTAADTLDDKAVDEAVLTVQVDDLEEKIPVRVYDSYALYKSGSALGSNDVEGGGERE